MDERIRFLSHKDQQVLVVDLSGCQPTEIMVLSTAARKIITSQPKASVRVLVDMTGAQLDRQAITRMKETAVYDAPFVKKSAWVGLDTVPAAHFQAIKTFSQREFFPFPTRAEALEWLAAD
ncbi:MAG TPA: hypothetical protein VE825_07565 [Terriglobales bacterium]|jgi:hypothetical protein|nr:hypothetical protein [Terriglobales bacterium]